MQIVPGGATPTSGFMDDVFSGANLITLVDIGSIPKGTRVSVSSAYVDCDTWVYEIYSEAGEPAWATQDQLGYAPDYTPGAPTATYDVMPTLAGMTAYTIGDPTNLREKPTLDSAVIAELPPNTSLVVIGEWKEGGWYLVSWSGVPSGQAWVYASLVQLQGDESQLPQVTPMP
jgi:hypothetical protein